MCYLHLFAATQLQLLDATQLQLLDATQLQLVDAAQLQLLNTSTACDARITLNNVTNASLTVSGRSSEFILVVTV